MNRFLRRPFAPLLLAYLLLWPGLFSPIGLSVRANSIAQSEIELTSFELAPSAGTLTWISASWDLRVFTEALNSLGDLDQQFQQQLGVNIQVQSTVPHAEAQAEAKALPSGKSSSLVETLGVSPLSASSTSRADFQAEFMITGVSGPVSLQILAFLQGSGSVQTDQSAVAKTEELFAVELDGSPLIHLSKSLSLGPNDSDSFAFSQSLSASIDLPVDTAFILTLHLDPESTVSPAPEGGPGFAMFLGFAFLFVVKAFSEIRHSKIGI